jgi:hypothetical protein
VPETHTATRRVCNVRHVTEFQRFCRPFTTCRMEPVTMTRCVPVTTCHLEPYCVKYQVCRMVPVCTPVVCQPVCPPPACVTCWKANLSQKLCRMLSCGSDSGD